MAKKERTESQQAVDASLLIGGTAIGTAGNVIAESDHGIASITSPHSPGPIHSGGAWHAFTGMLDRIPYAVQQHNLGLIWSQPKHVLSFSPSGQPVMHMENVQLFSSHEIIGTILLTIGLALFTAYAVRTRRTWDQPGGGIMGGLLALTRRMQESQVALAEVTNMYGEYHAQRRQEMRQNFSRGFRSLIGREKT